MLNKTFHTHTMFTYLNKVKREEFLNNDEFVLFILNIFLKSMISKPPKAIKIY